MRAVLALVVAIAAAPLASAANVDFPRYPSISPDGSTIAFSWRGDIFTARLDPAAPSIDAKRLTNHPLDELYSAFTPDNQRLLFTSEQLGGNNVFSINLDGTDPTPITRSDRFFVLSGAHPDGTHALGHARREGDVFRGARPYAASLDTGRIERLHDAFGNYPAASPSGDRIVFERGGSRWSRRHYRGPDARNVWLYDTNGQTFTQLTTWQGNDGLPKFKDDNTVLFLSDRELDTVNLYQADLDPETNQIVPQSVRRLTSFEGQDVQSFDADARGRTAVIHVWDTLYTVDLNRPGRPPRELVITATEDLRDNIDIMNVNGDADQAALAPDGTTMAFIAHGDLFIRNIEDDDSPTRRIPVGESTAVSRERNPAWSPDGVRLYFQSDLDGTESIYAATVDVTRSELRDRALEVVNPAALEEEDDTPLADDDDQPDTDELQTSADHPLAGVWTGSVEAPGPNGNLQEMPLSITITADNDGNLAADLSAMGLNLAASTVTFNDPDISITVNLPDGTSAALTGTLDGTSASGDWTAGEMAGSWSVTKQSDLPTADQDNDDTSTDEPDTETPTSEDDDAETPDHLKPERWHDAIRFNIEPVVQTPFNDLEPLPLPHGTAISFRRTRGDIVIKDLVTGEERTVVESWDTAIDWRFTNDARYMVHAKNDMDFNADVFITPLDGSHESINLTMHPDSDWNPRISDDGKVLAFISERRNEEYDVYRVHLDRALDRMAGPELDAYYEAQEKAAKARKPIDPIDFEKLRADAENPGDPAKDDGDEDSNDNNAEPLDIDDLRSAFRRLRRVTSLEGSEYDLELTPDGNRMIFSGVVSGSRRAIHSVDRDGGDRKRVTANANVQHFSDTANKLVFVRSGSGGTASPTGNDELHSINHTITRDLATEASQKFNEAARTLGDEFYHETMKDLDWPALTRRYHELATQTRTPHELAHVISRFLGELNASHLGAFPAQPSSDIAQPSGRLGINHTALPQPDGTVHYRVDRVIFNAPAFDTDMQLLEGDTITAVELEPIREPNTLETALAGRIGEETIITVNRDIPTEGDAGAPETVELDLLITPISYGAENNLRYTDWTLERERRVHEMSDGRLGYLHIRAMGTGNLDVFERDLFAAGHGRDALIIDVRNNGGGRITDFLLGSIMVRPHAYTIPRGGDLADTDAYPQDRLYIQRYTKPINLLINEKSFSNAEIFAHAFNALDRGTTVGMQTYGGVISTGAFRLVDGTTVRLPFRGWYLEDGTDMENYGAEPDIEIPKTPEAESADRDEQLEAAVRELLNRIDSATPDQR